MKRLFLALCLILTLVATASAGLQVNQLIGFGAKQAAGGSKALTVAFGSSDGNTSGPTVHTGSGMTLGAGPGAGERRFIVVLAEAADDSSSTTTVSGITVNGNSASPLVIADLDSGGDTFQVALYVAEDSSTDTTGDVVVTWSQAVDESFIATWRVVGGTTFDGTANDTDAQATASTTVYTGTLNVVTDGAIIAANGGVQSRTTTWSGTSGVSEDFDASWTRVASGASATTSTDASQTAIATSSASQSRGGFAAVTFAP